MSISCQGKTTYQPTSSPRTLRTSRAIRLLAYTVVLGCILGVLQLSVIGVSVTPTLPRLIPSESLKVVGIGGHQHVERSYELHNTVGRQHQGGLLRRRHVIRNAQNGPGAGGIKASFNDTQIIQTSSKSATPLATEIIGDQSQPTSVAVTLTEDAKTSEKVETTTNQSIVEQTSDGAESQITATPSTKPTGQNTDLSKPVESQAPNTSLQSVSSTTEVVVQEPTIESTASSTITSESTNPSQINVASTEPQAPVPTPTSSPVFSLVASSSIKTPDVLVSTSSTQTSSQGAQEVPKTTAEIRTTLTSGEPVGTTATIPSATQETIASEITATPQNTAAAEPPTQELSTKEPSASIPTTTTTTTNIPVIVPIVGGIVGDALGAVGETVGSVLDPAKEVLPASSSEALLEVPSTTTSLEPEATGGILGTIPVPNSTLSPTTRTEGNSGTTTPTDTTVPGRDQSNSQATTQSQTPASNNLSITTSSEDSNTATATPVISDSTGVQALPTTATAAAFIEVPTSTTNSADGPTSVPSISPDPSQPQSTEVPTSTDIASDTTDATATSTTTTSNPTSDTATITPISTVDTTGTAATDTNSIATITSTATTPTATSISTSDTTTAITAIDTTDTTINDTALTTLTTISDATSITTSATTTSTTSDATPVASLLSTSAATTAATTDITTNSTSAIATPGSAGISTTSGTITTTLGSESTTATESPTVTQPASSSTDGSSTSPTTGSQSEQVTSSSSIEILPVPINSATTTSTIATSSTVDSISTAPTDASTIEDSATAFSSVVQLSTSSPSASQTPQLPSPTGADTETATSTGTVESATSTPIPSIALQSVVVESSGAKSTFDPTTFITTTSRTTKPSATPKIPSSAGSSQTAKGSPSPDANPDFPQTAPAVTPTPATPVDVPEVVVPITRASDVPPSAEVTAGTSIDKDGNEVQIVAFYDATSGQTFGTDRATVFEGGASSLDISFSFVFAMTALVGQLFVIIL